MWLLGETGQVPTVEVPGTALLSKRGRFLFFAATQQPVQRMYGRSSFTFMNAQQNFVVAAEAVPNDRVIQLTCYNPTYVLMTR